MKEIHHLSLVPLPSLPHLHCLLYINDLPKIINKTLTPIIFADDTSILFTHSNWIDSNKNISIVFTTLSKWLGANQLTLNFNKTNYVQKLVPELNALVLCRISWVWKWLSITLCKIGPWIQWLFGCLSITLHDDCSHPKAPKFQRFKADLVS